MSGRGPKKITLVRATVLALVCIFLGAASEVAISWMGAFGVWLRSGWGTSFAGVRERGRFGYVTRERGNASDTFGWFWEQVPALPDSHSRVLESTPPEDDTFAAGHVHASAFSTELDRSLRRMRPVIWSWNGRSASPQTLVVEERFGWPARALVHGLIVEETVDERLFSHDVALRDAARRARALIGARGAAWAECPRASFFATPAVLCSRFARFRLVWPLTVWCLRCRGSCCSRCWVGFDDAGDRG